MTKESIEIANIMVEKGIRTLRGRSECNNLICAIESVKLIEADLLEMGMPFQAARLRKKREWCEWTGRFMGPPPRHQGDLSVYF
ncbi:MAG: hypothetical protein SVK08_08805 [Halobacteriota archaeon]|nr:hypothetical protein [Halobacteriota archaeon]